MVVAEPSPDRVLRRILERKTRQRRAARCEHMRSTVAALERAVPIVLTLDTQGDENAVQWDGFLDADAMRVRQLMHKSLQLTKEAQRLQSTQRQLRQLMQEHQLASRIVAGVVGAAPRDDWESNVLRWRMLTRKYYKPWSLADCATEVHAALNEMHTLLWSTNTLSTGTSFLGWRDRRVVDRCERSLEFVFYKDFFGLDMLDFVDKVWHTYTTPDAYHRIIIGGQGRSSLDLVQQLSPTMSIVRFDERYPMVDVDVHHLYLLCRVDIEGGCAMCVRSIPSPELEKAIDRTHDNWGADRIWFKWERLHDSTNDFRFYVGGYIAGNDLDYANYWLVEVLASAVRCEAMITHRRLLTVSG